jgi:hypothetical protein
MRGLPQLVANRREPLGRAVLVILLLIVGFALQAQFALRYPQPPLFGDPDGYFQVGRRLQAALELARAEGWSAAWGNVRGVLYFAGAGTVFGLLDALRPHDLAFLRLVFGGFNSLAALGAFLIARRLSASYWGGVAALLFMALHPSFSVELAKLFPDPVTGCLFTWSGYLYLRGIDEERRVRWFFGAGALLGAGAFVRSQLMDYLGALLLVAIALTAPGWWRRGKARVWVLASLVGFSIFAAPWRVIVRSVGNRLEEIEALGNFTFRQRYPYGFWQFLDSDGWMGPYRLSSEPYYLALKADAAQRGWRLESRREQWLFTLRYVARRWRESTLLVLDNVYRLYDRPPNRYKWPYPWSERQQLALHRGVLLLAVLGLALFVARRRANLGLFFVPLALALLHGLSYPWPRFAQPALPLLIAVAGATAVAVGRLVARVSRAGWRQLSWALLTAAALGLVSALSRSAELAAVLRTLALMIVLGLPFLLCSAAARGRRAPYMLTWLVLVVLIGAHRLRSADWHTATVELGGGVAAARQEIALDAEAWSRLRSESQAFLALDLEAPDGDVGTAAVTVNGTSVPEGALLPTIPRLGEFTLDDGPPRRGFPQWWVIRLTPELLGGGGDKLVVELRAEPRRRLLLRADTQREAEREYDGPSFNEWPHVAGIKFDYDGDSRLRTRRPLASSGTRSYVRDASGGWYASASTHRIRVVVLAGNESRISWESGPPPRAPRATLAFSATSGGEGAGTLAVQGAGQIDLPLGRVMPYTVERSPLRLCYQPLPFRRPRPLGAYFLTLPVSSAGEAVQLSVGTTAALSNERSFFLLAERALEEIRPLAARCRPPVVDPLTAGALRTLNDTQSRYPEQTGRFRVKAVY